MDTPFDTLPGGEEYRQWQRRVSACCATAHEWFDAHPCTRQFGEAYAYLVEVAGKLSEIYSVPLEEIARVTTENACRMFRTTDLIS